MEYFEKYVSNTVAGSGNQYFFKPEDPEKTQIGRVFYKIFKGGSYHYSILFSNVIDSTFNMGDVSHKNLICDQWQMESLKVALCKECNVEKMVEPGAFIPLTFRGESSKMVMPGEFFYTDEILLDAADGDYLCLEMAFRGSMIPCHPESLLPTFVLQDGAWAPSKNLPFAGMIGCDRKVKRKIGFWGDSITQGIGTAPNSYLHWNALLAQMLGDENAYWNLGLGFARAEDAASDGAWMYKAKQCDVLLVCFGVNDILRGRTDHEIIRDLQKTVDYLNANRIPVLLQTVPPFDYDAEKRKVWETVNGYIHQVLSKQCVVFDNTSVLGDPEKGLHMAKYGGHPDAVGCAQWAKALYESPELSQLLKNE